MLKFKTPLVLFCLFVAAKSASFAPDLTDVRFIYDHEPKSLDVSNLALKNEVGTDVVPNIAIVPSEPIQPDLPNAELPANAVSPAKIEKLKLMLGLAESVASIGIKSVRQTAEAYAATQGEVSPITEEQWDNFDKNIHSIFSAIPKSSTSSQVDDVVYNEIVEGFTDASDNFIRSVKAANETAPVATQNPGFFQNFATTITNGLQQISNTLTGRNDTVPPPPGPIQTILNSFQTRAPTPPPAKEPLEAPSAEQIFQNEMQIIASTFAQSLAASPGSQVNSSIFQRFQDGVQEAVIRFQHLLRHPPITIAPTTPKSEPTAAVTVSQRPLQQISNAVGGFFNSFRPAVIASTGRISEKNSKKKVAS